MTGKKNHSDHFPEIPDLKVHRTGRKRRKRRGVLGIVRPHHAAPLAKPVSAVLASNLGLFGLIAFVAAASAGYGTLRAPEYARYRAGRAHAAVAGAQVKKQLQYEGDLTDLPRPSAGPKDSVGLVWDKTAEQKAAELAAARVSAQAEAEAQARAEAAAGPVDVASVGGVELNALAAKAAGKDDEKAGAPKELGHKYGSLSQNAGAAQRLAGGMGMAGGLGRGFDAPKLKADISKLVAMRPGASPARMAARASAPYHSNAQGIAARQLDHAHHFSGRAIYGGVETSKQTAAQAFEGTTADGRALAGAGAVTGNSPKDSMPAETPIANQPGGPIGGHGGYTAPETVAGVSVDPTDGIISTLKILLGVAAALLLLQMVLVNESWTVFGTAAWEINADAIMILGLGILALGITLATMGRPILGTMYSVVAAGVIAAAWFGTPAADGTGLLALLGGGILAGVMPFLDPKDIDNKSWNAKKGNWD